MDDSREDKNPFLGVGAKISDIMIFRDFELVVSSAMIFMIQLEQLGKISHRHMEMEVGERVSRDKRIFHVSAALNYRSVAV